MQEDKNKNKAVLLEDQVSGKLPKYTDKTGKLIYKKLSSSELNFYLIMKNINVSSLDHSLS